MAFQERQLQIVSWDKAGTIIEGRLLRSEKVRYSDGVGIKYFLRARDGAMVSFKGATQLDMMLCYDDIGKMIRVEYVGTDATKEVKEGFSPAKVFRVAVDESSKPKDNDPGITDDDIPF